MRMILVVGAKTSLTRPLWRSGEIRDPVVIRRSSGRALRSHGASAARKRVQAVSREEAMLPNSCRRIAWQALVALSFAAFLSAAPAHAADPMKVGVSLALTG